MKVICAGMPKTGTKSMAKALRILGYTVYDAFEELCYNSDRWIEIFDGKHDNSVFKEMYSDIDAVTDLPAVAMWDQILEAFPDSKVILLTRDSEEDWIESFRNTFYNTPLYRFRSPNFLICHFMWWIFSPKVVYKSLQVLSKSRNACFGFFASAFHRNEMLARSAYRRHNAYVLKTCPNDQLLVYNINEGWAPLCEFLNKVRPEVEFPFLNKDSRIVDSDLGEENIKVYFRMVEEDIKSQITMLLCGSLVFIASVLWWFWR